MQNANAGAAQLGIRCSGCNRVLSDAASIECGYGPECRRRAGHSFGGVSTAARAEANHILSVIMRDDVDKETAVDMIWKLRGLGFDYLPRLLEDRWVDVTIELDQRDYVVTAPHVEAAIPAWRAIPGRQWLADRQANRVPMGQKWALWHLLRAHYAGMRVAGPAGTFTIA